MLSDEEIKAFMNEPRQRQVEVVVGHRIGYWGDGDIEACTTAEIEEADAYLEAHIQWRIEQALAERGLGENPTRRVIHIEPTDAQWLTIDRCVGRNPNVAKAEGRNLFLYNIEDDNVVELYNIAPGGDYTYESLVDGFHNGWTTFDSDGNKVEIDD